MDNESYVVIQGWMCNELGLKGNDLLVYALIYGFSQDGESVFNGSRSYIANTFNISLPTVDKALNNLIDSGLIEKMSNTVNNVVFNQYRTLRVVKKLYRGSKETLYNNTKNNNTDISSKDNISSEQAYDDVFQFGVTKQSKPNLYQKCMMLIDEWTNIQSIHDLLKQYLDLCMEMKSIRGANQWKGMLNTLEKVQKQCHPHTYEEIIQMSIQYGWKTFHPINDNHKGISGQRFDDLIRKDASYDNVSHTRSDKEF